MLPGLGRRLMARRADRPRRLGSDRAARGPFPPPYGVPAAPHPDAKLVGPWPEALCQRDRCRLPAVPGLYDGRTLAGRTLSDPGVERRAGVGKEHAGPAGPPADRPSRQPVAERTEGSAGP